MLLRYIDAIDFNYEEENIFSFLAENLKINITIYDKLFKETGVSNLPLGFDFKFSFPASRPNGAIHLRFFRGKKKNVDVLIWENIVQSMDNEAPKSLEEIKKWVTEAHNLTDNWFFKMIEGELLRRFE